MKRPGGGGGQLIASTAEQGVIRTRLVWFFKVFGGGGDFASLSKY